MLSQCLAKALGGTKKSVDVIWACPYTQLLRDAQWKESCKCSLLAEGFELALPDLDDAGTLSIMKSNFFDDGFETVWKQSH